MTLANLIAFLEKADSDLKVLHGFSSPHSYRGYYERLAFEPAADVTVKSMLDCAKSALGSTYEGYKGGEYTMGEYTECYLAEYGSCGDEIGESLLTLMLNEALMSVGKETSLVGELRAQVSERDRLIKDLRERVNIAETRERAAHERARVAEEVAAQASPQ